MASGPRTAAAASAEDELRGVFLIQMTSFIKWPAEAKTPEESAFHLCFAGAGSKELAGVVGRHLEDRRINDRRAVADHFPDLPGLQARLAEGEACHVAFFSDDAREWLPSLKPDLTRTYALQVGESLDFIESGGQIAIVFRTGKPRPFADLEALGTNGFKLDARLVGILREP